MHEYRLCEDLSQATPNFLGAFALCRVVKRNEPVQTKGKKRSFVSTPDSSTESGKMMAEMQPFVMGNKSQFSHNYPMDFNMETSIPSYSSLAEDFFASPLHSTDTYSGVQDTTLQNLDLEMLSYINQPSIGLVGCNVPAFPSICRQASDADEASLWLQEEGWLVGM
ncbi:NAC domain-containing protein 86-like [Iris pallida]|uniref:NAC domain-containing protein 86-like n=1 Tax=Iris pallida TaxID=29817 RepID=A0AAX6EK94_IRIPA|nr:NAC domain-containing protein 86-like [Iris pallida]